MGGCTYLHVMAAKLGVVGIGFRACRIPATCPQPRPPRRDPQAAKAPDGLLAAAVASALDKLPAEADLEPEAAAAVAAVREAAAKLRLVGDVAKLDMGPGCTDVLRRLDARLAAAQEAASTAPPAPAADGEEKEEAGEEGEKEAEEEGEAAKEEEAAGPKVAPERLAEGRRLVAELLGEGLVLLELQPAANRKLQVGGGCGLRVLAAAACVRVPRLQPLSCVPYAEYRWL